MPKISYEIWYAKRSLIHIPKGIKGPASLKQLMGDKMDVNPSYAKLWGIQKNLKDTISMIHKNKKVYFIGISPFLEKEISIR